MDRLANLLPAINAILWHDVVLYILLGTGVLFTFWSGFSQYRALTHGVRVIRGRYDDPHDPGAINHFQALATALSATVGLGNIGGVALAIAVGGPGAVFWMWMVGFFGMALKSAEVTLSMLYRNTDEPGNPHGGPMWVAKAGFARLGLPRLGSFVGGLFCVTLIISAITGGNMFQAWNVAEITHTYFPTVPRFVVGVLLCLLVGTVVIGGIRRIGAVAGRLVPLMCALYLLAAAYVLVVHLGDVPAVLRSIVVAAFSPSEATGAFLGGTAGYAFLWGMKRALFSSEAGQGSAPIAHCAARTREPVREGVVAGLEPFIDTLVVCTLTTLVILLSGAWNRGPEATFPPGTELRFTAIPPASPASPRSWQLETPPLPPKSAEARRVANLASGPGWRANETLFLLVRADPNPNTDGNLHRVAGVVAGNADDGWTVRWTPLVASLAPEPVLNPDGSPHLGIYGDYVGAALTGHAFDRVLPGLGMWLVTLACWLFAYSTIISWCYYGEQGVIYLAGPRAVLPYKVAYCAVIVVATLGFIRTDAQLDDWTALGTGVMLFANIPILLLFGHHAMRAYRDYLRRLDRGELSPPHPTPPPIEDVVEDRPTS
ncbi:MAG: sodium:alanine symporter family protein [Verrucomicrobiae bacterium]|nr:sodium:alanine symporter family protein [Verrucomicrobiae bacterium]